MSHYNVKGPMSSCEILVNTWFSKLGWKSKDMSCLIFSGVKFQICTSHIEELEIPNHRLFDDRNGLSI